MTYQIFISHVQKDQKDSDTIYDYLDINGYKCFMDTRSLVPGKPFAAQIADAIRDCEVFILVFSKNADEARAVAGECAKSYEHNKQIIPARIQDAIPHNLAIFISAVQWCDLFPPPIEKHLPKLLKALPEPSKITNTRPDEEKLIREEPTLKELGRIVNALPFVPEELIKFLMRDFKDQYLADKGVWEKYTLKQHTIMVLNQFEKYFSNISLPGKIDRGFFRLILALHDIGVPMAIETGDRAQKFRYTSEILEAYLKRLNYKSQDIDLATSLVSIDPVGEYIKVKTDRKSDDKHKYWVSKASYDTVVGMAAKCQMQVNTYFELLLIYYMVDAGSYTADAGGKTGLDWLFVFEPSKRTMSFSPNVQEVINQFKRFLNPGPGCMWINDHDWHYIDYQYLKDWIKDPENLRKIDSGKKLDGHTFTYGKYRGRYQIQLRDKYDVAFYDPEN